LLKKKLLLFSFPFSLKKDLFLANMSSSNSIPKKALILHCPLEPNQPIPNVDLVTLKGCLGQMALEETKGILSALKFPKLDSSKPLLLA
jgi:hypothetical protein